MVTEASRWLGAVEWVDAVRWGLRWWCGGGPVLGFGDHQRGLVYSRAREGACNACARLGGETCVFWAGNALVGIGIG